MRPIVLLLLAVSCQEDPETLAWFETCGDPACGGYDGPFEGVPACTDEVGGTPCDAAGDQCDPQNDCNSLLICAATDPAADGCPISRAAAKKQIAYLDGAGLRAAAEAALRTRLATWRYRWEDDTVRPHLGFVIDDQPTGSPAVLPGGERVDLYGYTSLALAGLQAQQAELAALKAEVAALRAEVATCR